MDRPSTKTSGAMAEIGLSGDMVGILWMMAMKRKYMLAYRLNWPRRDSGRNVITLYLDVLMKLDGYVIECTGSNCTSNSRY